MKAIIRLIVKSIFLCECEHIYVFVQVIRQYCTFLARNDDICI